MAYLDNSTITVDAILTKKGRERLSSGGKGQNGFQITQFALGDDEIDNELYTGIYLVTKLRHTFDARVKAHEITMEVARDGLPVDLPSFGSQYTDVQKTKRPITV